MCTSVRRNNGRVLVRMLQIWAYATLVCVREPTNVRDRYNVCSGDCVRVMASVWALTAVIVILLDLGAH